MKNILNSGQVKSLAKKPSEGKYLDGSNSYLFVSKAGSLSFRYWGRTPDKTIWGNYSIISCDYLAEARDAVLEYAKLIANGISPKEYYECQKSLNLKFSIIAEEYIKHRFSLVRHKENSRLQELRTINNELVAKIWRVKLTHLSSEIIHKKLIQPQPKFMILPPTLSVH